MMKGGAMTCCCMLTRHCTIQAHCYDIAEYKRILPSNERFLIPTRSCQTMVAITRSALRSRLQSSTTTATIVASKPVKKRSTRKAKKAIKPSTSKLVSSSPLHAYNDVRGRSDIREALAHDQYGNPTGREYDLGRDGAFKGYQVLIAQFYSDFQFNDAAMQVPIDELNAKGFQVKLVKSEDACIAELASNRYTIAWIISTIFIQNPNFVPTLTTFHSNGGAIFLFADNTPYICHASEFLKAKFGVTVEGNYYGGQTLTYKEEGHQQTGHFGQHEIFTGIQNLFEGITISHPVFTTSKSRTVFTTLATATDSHSTIAVYDPPPTSAEGRLCLDCGFTKLYINWDTAGTARYIINASCWLLGIEKRFQ